MQLAALGLFVFSMDTALFDKLDRDRAWRHERTARFGARAASQFTGPGEDAVTLSGVLVPEIAGQYSAMETIAEMADTGEAWPLMNGRGQVLGIYTIDRLTERRSNLVDDGSARRNEFVIELTRVA